MQYEKKEVLIDIKNVTLGFDVGDYHKVILRDVSAEIRNITRPDCVQGQVVCFLGPSGIGKTQLSRVIAGLQAPTSGSVTLEGKPTKAGNVGMVPQNYILFDFLTVRDNFKLAFRMGRETTPYGPLIDAFDLKPHMDKYPRQLSGGQKQRVSIVRQLLVGNSFIVMDEPFSGLDILMKQRACELITQAANLDERNTIIVVTHDVTEGMSIADTVWLMGRDPNVEGARIVAEYDLASEDLCWHPDILHEPRFAQKVLEVKERFLEVAKN